MISLKQAREIAKKADPSVNKHVSYKSGWVFFEEPDDPRMESTKNGIAVLKKDGRTVSETDFYMNYM